LSSLLFSLFPCGRLLAKVIDFNEHKDSKNVQGHSSLNLVPNMFRNLEYYLQPDSAVCLEFNAMFQQQNVQKGLQKF